MAHRPGDVSNDHLVKLKILSPEEPCESWLSKTKSGLPILSNEVSKAPAIRWNLAEDGQSALDQMHAVDHDLVILDLMLPDMDGLEVLEKGPQPQGESSGPDSECARRRGRTASKAWNWAPTTTW